MAFLLRVYLLDAQSLWYDEALSARLAALPLDETVAQSASTDHPPLHAASLNLWINLAGSSEFSLRFASACFGTLAVALAYALGRRVGGRRVGWIAAGLLAISPMAVWYAQEARGYSLLVALILVATLAFLRLAGGDGRWCVWLAYVLASAAALYTHYFAAFYLASLNVACVVWLVARRARAASGPEHLSRFLLYWLVAQIGVVLLFAPWIPNAFAQAASNVTYFPGRVTWDTVALETWRAFAGGDFPHLSVPNLPPPTGILWLAIVGLGVAVPFVRRPWPVRAWPAWLSAVALVAVPIALMALLAWDKPKFAPRYLLPSLPAAVALGALGVDALLRFRNRLLTVLALIPLLLIPAVDLLVVAEIYFYEPVARPDGRAVAAYIEAHEQPDDAIVLVGGHLAPVFEYYYDGRAEIVPLPPGLLPAAQSPLDWTVVPRLAEIAANHSRVWLVLWQQGLADPTGIVLSQLSSQASRLEVGRRFQDMSLLLFNTTNAQFEQGPQRRLDALFSEPIRLVGYDLDSNQLAAGQDIDLRLYLQSDGPVARDYRVFTHLVGPDGSIIAQDDRIAGADSYPTSLWATGTLMRNVFRIRVPETLPPGTYRLLAGLYDDPDRRLPLADGGDAVELGTFAIGP